MSVDFSDEKADPEDGRFIGKAICRSIDIKLNNKSSALNLENKELEYHLGAKVDGNFVYINFGKFIVQKPENQEVNEETTLTALDYMSKFDIKYIPTITFPNTIGNIAEDVCKQCGVILGNKIFRNSDKLIQGNPFTNNEQGREIIKSIAKVSFSIAYIGQDNKLYFGFETKNDVSELISVNDYFETEKNNEIKPITKITLRSGEVPASGKSIKNDELINQYGENELIIEEDYFSYTDALRNAFLEEADYLFGLTYCPINVDLEGSVYLNFEDVIEITNLNNEKIKTYCFNNTHTYNGTLYNSISVPALTEVEEKYEYQDEDKTKRTKTFIEIDKANAKITQAVEQVGEQNRKISQITQTVDELNSKIGEVADVTITGESYNAQVFLEGINASEPILIKIRPYLQSISALYPSKSLFPGKGIYPKGNPKLIFFDRDNNNMWTYMLPDDLNYIDENTYDEFLLDYENQICSVTKRVGIDENGALYKLDIPYSTQYDYPTITLEDGNYNIYLDTYNNGYLFVKLMSANIYTSQFATKVELNSEIKQTKSEIDLSVSEKLTGYPTTTEMNSAINVKANEINLKVEKKVDEEEFTGANIMLAINDDVSSATIKADKINLNGVVTANEKFKIKTDGSMEAVDGTFTGGNISIVDNSDTYNGARIKCYNNNLNIASFLYSNGLYIGEPTETSANGYITNLDLDGLNTAYMEDDASVDGVSIHNQGEYGAYVRVFSPGTQTSIYSDGIWTPLLTQTSKAETKKNFVKLENALDIVKATDIYKYNLKNEEDTTKKHIGFVIGDDYNYSEEITSKNNDGVDIYSMVSVCMKAIQEQQEQIEELQNKLKEMEEKLNEKD